MAAASMFMPNFQAIFKVLGSIFTFFVSLSVSTLDIIARVSFRLLSSRLLNTALEIEHIITGFRLILIYF